MIHWIHLNKFQSDVNSISLLYDGRRFIDAIFKCIPSVKSLVFRVRIMNDVCSRGTIFCKSTLVWEKAYHRFGDKPLSKHVLTKLTVTNMSCAWRRPFCPGQKKNNQNITTNISRNINLFQMQNMKQYWQKGSGKGCNMILIISGKGRNIILIRAQWNREKILLIADRAHIDRLLILWRACQERVCREKSVNRTQ